MKKKKMISIILVIVCCLMLFGCADAMPDMTQEEQSIVAEYAADLLLKYSKNYDDGLADVNSMTDEEIQQESETLETENEEIVENSESSIGQESGMEHTEDTGNIENLSVEEILQLNDMAIIYQDCEIMDSYPKNEMAYFSVNAREGCKIAVLRFEIQNLLSEEQECNIFSLNAKFAVNINDNGYLTNMSTLLLEDLSVFEGQIPADGNVEAVILVEVDDDLEEIDSIQMKISVKDNSTQIKLF